MTPEQNAPTDAALPRDAAEALELWDKGEPIAAFEVESEGSTQQEIYAAAFYMIRNGNVAMVEGVRTPQVQRARGGLRTNRTTSKLDGAHEHAPPPPHKGWPASGAPHSPGEYLNSQTLTTVAAGKHLT